MIQPQDISQSYIFFFYRVTLENEHNKNIDDNNFTFFFKKMYFL